jgi:hypothetical protein
MSQSASLRRFPVVFFAINLLLGCALAQEAAPPAKCIADFEAQQKLISSKTDRYLKDVSRSNSVPDVFLQWSFDEKQLLREIGRKHFDAGTYSRECHERLWAMLDSLSHLQDYAAHYAHEKSAYYKVQDKKIHPGDVISETFKGLLSTAVANITPLGRYSHLAMIAAKQDKNGKDRFYRIDVGPGVSRHKSVSDYSKEGSAIRFARFRLRDDELAKEASKILEARYAAEGRFYYDAMLDDGEDKKLYCSETVRFALEKAAVALGRDFRAALYESILPMARRQTIRIGQFKLSQHSFMPSDIDGDPRFILVEEYINPRAAYGRLLDDAAMARLIELIEASELKDEYASRKKPIANSLGFKFRTSRSHKKIAKFLEESNRAFQKSEGRLMTFDEALAASRKVEMDALTLRPYFK